MRKTLSPPAARLWRQLKALRAEGLQFRREHPFAGYYLDFVCLSRRLVVEVDGEHHGLPDQARHDARRDSVLSREGFLVVRYAARDVMTNLDGVLAGIIDLANARPRRWIS